MRLGFRQVKGLREEDMNILVANRRSFYTTINELRNTGLSETALEKLADADAFRSIGLDRRQALWGVSTKDRPEGLIQTSIGHRRKRCLTGNDGIRACCAGLCSDIAFTQSTSREFCTPDIAAVAYRYHGRAQHDAEWRPRKGRGAGTRTPASRHGKRRLFYDDRRRNRYSEPRHLSKPVRGISKTNFAIKAYHGGGNIAGRRRSDPCDRQCLL